MGFHIFLTPFLSQTVSLFLQGPIFFHFLSFDADSCAMIPLNGTFFVRKILEVLLLGIHNSWSYNFHFRMSQFSIIYLRLLPSSYLAFSVNVKLLVTLCWDMKQYITIQMIRFNLFYKVKRRKITILNFLSMTVLSTLCYE